MGLLKRVACESRAADEKAFNKVHSGTSSKEAGSESKQGLGSGLSSARQLVPHSITMLKLETDPLKEPCTFSTPCGDPACLGKDSVSWRGGHSFNIARRIQKVEQRPRRSS